MCGVDFVSKQLHGVPRHARWGTKPVSVGPTETEKGDLASGSAVAGWVQGVAVTAVGAGLGFGIGRRLGAVAGGVLSGLFAVPFGRAVAECRPYHGSARGVRRCILDATWSSLNTWAGAIYYGLHRMAGNHHDVVRSTGSGSIWLVNGVVPRYATTIGTVKAGSTDAVDRHEEIHVFQARLFGPLYLPLVVLNYVVATVVPYWLLFYDKARYPITGFASYFEHGVYPHVWNELWAYRATGRVTEGGRRRS